jgi:hypothetical protein
VRLFPRDALSSTVGADQSRRKWIGEEVCVRERERAVQADIPGGNFFAKSVKGKAPP